MNKNQLLAELQAANAKITELEQDLKIVRATLEGQRNLNNQAWEREKKLEQQLKKATDLIRKFHPEDFMYEESEDLIEEVLIFLKASETDLQYYLGWSDEETKEYLKSRGE